MGETVKYRTFCSEDMGEKPVGQIPGVGLLSARKLTNIGYPKARDLYSKLRKLNFDVKKFRVWMALNCAGARVTIIYQALYDWHAQFGDTRTKGLITSTRVSGASTSSGGGDGGSSGSGGSGDTAGISKKTSIRRPRVSFAPSPEPRPQPSTSRDTSTGQSNYVPPNNNNNSLLNFLTSFSGIVQNISPELHTQFMLDILNVMKQYENKSKDTAATAPNTPAPDH